MPRRKYKKVKRDIADPKYNDQLIGLTINMILKRGKKSTAERILYTALDEISNKTGKDPVEVYRTAIKNISPGVQVKSRRVGGATYQVPMEIPQERSRTLAIRWLLRYARERRGAGFAGSLADEIIDASEHKGGAIKKRSDTHKMAEANKAFSHYRF